MLGAYIFTIVISSLIDPLIIMQYPSLSLITVFYFIYFIFHIYLFMYLFGCVRSQLQHVGSQLQHAGSLLQHVRSFVVVCGLFIVACGLLSSCGAGALEHAGLVVAARRLSCFTACGILVPQPGIKPTSPALEGRFLTTGPPGKSPVFILKSILFDMSTATTAFFWFPFAWNNFPSLLFQFVCVHRSEVGLLQTAYIWVLFLYPFSLCLLTQAFNPFTFKVIIYMYVLIAIFLIVLGLFFQVFLLPFLFCSLAI